MNRHRWERRIGRAREWADEVRVYRHECAGARDFIRLMRVRLSQSKVGHLVTPRPIVVDVDCRTLGPAVRLRSHSTDISVFKELLVGDSYEPLPPDLAAESVVDLGANIGLSFRWLRARYPGARFLCVEPDPANLEILRANVGAVDEQVAVVAACVGGHDGRARLGTTGGEWGFRMTDTDVPLADTREVALTTMDTLLADSDIDRIDVLKCDIEGAESFVFENCRSWIDRVDAMSVECHADSMTTEALLQALNANGARFAVRHVEQNPEFGFDIVTVVRDSVAA